MNISKIFPKNRQQLIESLEFSSFLYEISISFKTKYRTRKNRLINFFLKVVSWWRDWEFEQVKDYKQLLYDYPFWKSRHYYRDCMRKFLECEINTPDFIDQILYPILSAKTEAQELWKDFKLQAEIELNQKSLEFSTILSDLTLLLEGFDVDPEASFFSEEEFRQTIQNALMKIGSIPLTKINFRQWD